MFFFLYCAPTAINVQWFVSPDGVVFCQLCWLQRWPESLPESQSGPLWRWPHSGNPRLPKAIADIGRGLLRSSYNPSTPHVSCWCWCYVALIGIPRQFFFYQKASLYAFFPIVIPKKARWLFLRFTMYIHQQNKKQIVIKPFVTVITTSKEGVWPFALTTRLIRTGNTLLWIVEQQKELRKLPTNVLLFFLLFYRFLHM